MTQQEFDALKQRVAANDPNAMFAYAELMRTTDSAEYEKYLTLAAQLGQPQAAERVGDMLIERGDYENAAHNFKTGAKAGLMDCAAKLAAIKLSVNEPVALRELEELAESGVQSACIALASYHKSKGNRKEAAFWRSLVN